MTTENARANIATIASWRPVISILMPHPPIAIPAVAGDRGAKCRDTTDACRRVAGRLVASTPDRLVLISPHTPRDRRAFGLVADRREGHHRSEDRLGGDLARFGAPGARVDLPSDSELADSLERQTQESSPPLRRLPNEPLDHGAVVPLLFLAEAGWNGPTTVIGLPWQHSAETGRRFGRRLAAALADAGGRTALVASGDMSHRCLPDAPAGFHPRAVEFDRELTQLVATGDFAAIAQIDAELRELAAEDTSETALIVTAAHDFDARGAEVISYEHPFGVGYLVAVFFDGSSPTV